MSGELHRDGFDYIEFLRRRDFIGPVFRLSADEHAATLEGLLVPLEIALAEIVNWSGQDIARSEFTRYLKQSGVFLGDAEDLQKQKQKAKEQGLQTAKSTTGKLKDIADALEVSYSRIDGNTLAGRSGLIRDDGSISVESRSKRHLSGIKRRLGFLEQTADGFKLDHTPTTREAEAIRTALGMKKRPSARVTEKVEAPLEEVAS